MKLGRRVIRHINFTLRRRIDGRWIKLPVLGGLKAGISGQRFLLDILKHFLPKLDGAIVDVGVNIGQTLCKVKLADPHQSYYGFEPNAACHAYVEQLVRINDWTNVSIFPCGLSDRTRMLHLHVSPDKGTDGFGSFLPCILPDGTRENHLSWAKPAAVFAYTEIAYLIEERIALLKIDVEGTELEVVRGMADVIHRDEPIVVIELIPDESLIGRHEETITLLQSLGYNLFSIGKQRNSCWSGLKPMRSYVTPDDLSMSDYLAIPRSKRSFLDDVPA